MTKESVAQSLHGILLPVTTPFSLTSDLDLASLNSNLSRWRRSGIRGFVLLGSTGERVHLNEREYVEVIETARAATPLDKALIVGAGQQSTVGSIAEINKAAAAGADAVLVITPSFYRSAISQETLFEFYTAVADASPVPVLLYSMPALTGIKIEPTTIARLSEHENIVGAKDSSNDIETFRETVGLCSNNFAVMTGNGTVLMDALKAGATGGILAVGCAVPEACVEIFNAFQTGQEERARELQSKLTPLAAAVTTRFGIGGLKAALDMNGYVGGRVREPLKSPDETAKSEIAELLAAMKEESVVLSNMPF
jgi:4-hydroxy-2-oxoglutarate aldolase